MKQLILRRLTAILLPLLVMVFWTGSALAEEVDYSQPSSWAYYGIGDEAEKPADLFIICPLWTWGRTDKWRCLWTTKS